MYVDDTTGPSTPLRMDPMSKARISWIKSQYENLKPTGSLIMRRALVLYVQHLEKALVDPKKIDHELAALKACKSGDAAPWHTQPCFACHPFKPLSAHVKEAHKKRLEGLLGSSPFAAQVPL